MEKNLICLNRIWKVTAGIRSTPQNSLQNFISFIFPNQVLVRAQISWKGKPGHIFNFLNLNVLHSWLESLTIHWNVTVQCTGMEIHCTVMDNIQLSITVHCPLMLHCLLSITVQWNVTVYWCATAQWWTVYSEEPMYSVLHSGIESLTVHWNITVQCTRIENTLYTNDNARWSITVHCPLMLHCLLSITVHLYTTAQCWTLYSEESLCSVLHSGHSSITVKCTRM